MIDSVTIKLNSRQFHLRDDNKFSERKTFGKPGYYSETLLCVKYENEQKTKGIYCPKFSLITRKGRETLDIQVSLPKLVYGSSLYDIGPKSLPLIFEKLLVILDDIGIDATINGLERAIVTQTDFSKIILLPDYLGPANEIVRTLSLFDYKHLSDFTIKEYANGKKGIYMKFLNETQGYVCYDKLGEILNQGYTKEEKAMQEEYEKGARKRNALRFELALQQKDSMEKFVSLRIKGKKKRDYRLDDLLNSKLSKIILMEVFDSVFSQVATGLITLSHMEDNRLLAYLDSTGLSPKKQQELFYWVKMATKYGIAGTWKHIALKYKGGSVGRHRAEIKAIIKKGQNKDELEDHWIKLAKCCIVAIMLRREWFDLPNGKDILK